MRTRHAPAWVPGLIGLGIALALSALLLTWVPRTPPTDTFSGWFQGDMPTYVCYARMADRTATAISYANPHDIREDAPPVLVNLPISVMAWLLRLGVPAAWLGHALRLLFGALMYGALGALLRRTFRPGAWFWSAFVLVGLGSGFAWLASLVDVGLDAPDLARRWRAGVEGLERPYYWWFLDTFRNLMYPLELAYHALIFAQLWALGTRRYGASVLFYALACLSNPFVGIQASGVQIGSIALASLRGAPRPALRIAVLSALVAAAFVAYYALLLPLDPIIAAIQEQHRDELREDLPLASLLLGHGPALLAPLALLIDAPFRRYVFRQFHLVPVALLAAWTLLLSQHGHFDLPITLQPMHFTRGYLHASLWIIALAWLQYRMSRSRLRRRGAIVAVAIAALVLPDNALFLEDQYRVGPHNPSLVWPSEWEQVHAFLRREPRGRRVLVNSYALSRQICALHEHHAAMGTGHTTPHYAERQAELEQLRRDPSREPPLVRWADILIANRRDPLLIAALRSSSRWEVQLENGAWVLFRRLASEPPEPRN